MHTHTHTHFKRTIAGLVVGMMAMSLVAASSSERDIADEMTFAWTSTAADQVEALGAQASLAPDNISCTIGSWDAVNQTSVEVIGVGFVNGRDVASADGVCSNLDVLGNPAEFTSFLRVTLEYLDPYSRVWTAFDSSTCLQRSVAGQAVQPQCVLSHIYLDKNDPVQTYIRRARFDLGVMKGTVAEVRSTRYFGPVADKAAFQLVDDGYIPAWPLR
jgi:hypothetical protein